MRVYQTFDKKNHEGKYYKEWDLPDGFPIPQGYVFVPPTEGLRNPKFNHSTSMWEECMDSLLEEALLENQVLREGIIGLASENAEIQMGLAEVYEMIMEGSL